MKTPPAEIEITPALIRSLIATQHPDLAELPLTYLSEGWDNVIYRLGEDYLIRLPRRAQALPFILREHKWLPQLAPRLPIPVPVPLRTGKSQDDYPWSWSITPWFSGRVAAEALPQSEEATRLAHFLRALHQIAPTDAPHNPNRACPLSERAPHTEERIKRFIAEGLLTKQALGDWKAALAAHDDEQIPALIHGDLHPKNILVDEGQFSAIIDWGDMTAGDPATDLASFWMLFGDAQARQGGLAAYAPDAAMLKRAKGWAIFFGTLLLDIGRGGDIAFEEVGEFTLRNLEQV